MRIAKTELTIDLTDSPESEIIWQAQHNNQDAFRELVRRYSELTQSVAFIVLGERSVVEDVVQESWLDVWRGLASFDATRPFRPWLCTLVANRCYKMRRRNWKRLINLEDALLELTHSSGDWRNQSESKLEMSQILARLNLEQQQLLALRFFADLQIEEISKILKLPTGTVKSRLHRTLATVRKLMIEEK